jgi:glycosyltransferase involved in cell wall biosynthesis
VEATKLWLSFGKNKSSLIIRLFFEIISGLELLIRIINSKSELVILSSPPFITVFIAHFGARYKKIPYILDIRDLYPDIYYHQGLIKKDGSIGKFLEKLTRNMYLHAKSIMTVNEYLKEKIIETAGQNVPVEIIVNGYDHTLFKESNEKFEKFTIVFHGNMGKVQNLNTIIECAEKLKNHTDINFLFIGIGPQSKILKETKLKNITYIGEKSYIQTSRLIAKAHIGISCRIDDPIGAEAIPVKVFEYLGVNIPTIVTPLSSNLYSQYVSDGIYEFKNEDINGIVAKILDLKSNYQKPKMKINLSRQELSKKLIDIIS